MLKQNMIDVREVTPRHRHPQIFAALDALEEGETLLLINDHDPAPLRYHLAAERPGAFCWEYQETGPEVWSVAITKQCNCC